MFKKLFLNFRKMFAVGDIFGRQRGAAAILLTLFILTIILLIASVAAHVMVFEIKMSGQITDSVVSFYAADALSEQCLYQAISSSGTCASAIYPSCFSFNFSNGASATVCRQNITTIKSSGSFKGITRAIEINGQFQ